MCGGGCIDDGGHHGGGQCMFCRVCWWYYSVESLHWVPVRISLVWMWLGPEYVVGSFPLVDAGGGVAGCDICSVIDKMHRVEEDSVLFVLTSYGLISQILLWVNR